MKTLLLVFLSAFSTIRASADPDRSQTSFAQAFGIQYHLDHYQGVPTAVNSQIPVLWNPRLMTTNVGLTPANYFERQHPSQVEAAEALNAMRMRRYREQCELLKHAELLGTPSVYPTQLPFLENR